MKPSISHSILEKQTNNSMDYQKFVGKFVLADQDNLDEYLKAIGIYKNKNKNWKLFKSQSVLIFLYHIFQN